MVKSLKYYPVLLALLLTSCFQDKDQSPESKIGTVSFAPVMSASQNGGRILQELPEGISLIISIESSSGEPVLTQHEVELLKVNGEYISSPMELDAGDYQLTEFLLVNEDNQVIYATPKSGSVMAEAVSQPLTISFSVEEYELSLVSPELIDVSELLPEDIGYVSFHPNLVNHFFLTAMIPDGGSQPMTSATAYVLVEGDTVKTQALMPRVNAIGFAGEVDEEFTLVVMKSGYAKYSETWTISDIKATYERSIVPALLEEALTFSAVPLVYQASVNSFDFSVTFSGELTVDWGDGQSTEATATGGFKELSHDYATAGPHPVAVTGDIQTITELKLYYGNAPISEINLSHVPALEDFRSGWNGTSGSPKVFDFSHNHNLTYIDVSHNLAVDSVIIPANSQILHLDISGPNDISTADLDPIVDLLHASVVSDGRIEGRLQLESHVDETVAGPPSSQALVKLRELRDIYYWEIVPDPGS